MYRYQLEKYRGRSTRHVCPQCGRKNVFTRYVDTYNNNIYVSDNVGKCNRLDKCGYHYTPHQYFTDNPWKRDNLPREGGSLRPWKRDTQPREKMIFLFFVLIGKKKKRNFHPSPRGCQQGCRSEIHRERRIVCSDVGISSMAIHYQQCLLSAARRCFAFAKHDIQRE